MAIFTGPLLSGFNEKVKNYFNENFWEPLFSGGGGGGGVTIVILRYSQISKDKLVTGKFGADLGHVHEKVDLPQVKVVLNVFY